jgi:hypothetical protein
MMLPKNRKQSKEPDISKRPIISRASRRRFGKQFLCLAFGQLTHRESMSDTMLCPELNAD